MTILTIETLIWLLSYLIVLFYGTRILSRYWGYVRDAKRMGHEGRLLVAKSRRRMFGILVFKAALYVLIGIVSLLRLSNTDFRQVELWEVDIFHHAIVMLLVLGALLQALVFYILEKDDSAISLYNRVNEKTILNKIDDTTTETLDIVKGQ